jgi:hypothetical protein
VFLVLTEIVLHCGLENVTKFLLKFTVANCKSGHLARGRDMDEFEMVIDSEGGRIAFTLSDEE